MSLFKEALAQKKFARKEEQRLKAEAMQKARMAMTAEARLSALLENIAKIFEDDAVQEVTLEIDDLSIPIVSNARYEGKLEEYETEINGKYLIVRPKILSLT